MRPLEPADAAELARGLHATFEDAVEYCGWSQERFAEEPARVIDGFFSGKRGTPSPASRAALREAGGAITGAALVTEHDEESARLDLLYVAPDWQRQGMATALVSAVLNELAAAGKTGLIATWHLGNDAAIAWYRKFGFAEEPDWANARLYLRAAEQELRRFAHFGERDAVKRTALVAEKEKWKREVARLQQLMDAGDKAGAFASHRFHLSRSVKTAAHAKAAKTG